MLEAFFEGGDLAEPCLVLRLDEALLGVLGHLVDAAELGGIDAQESASGASVLVHAGRAVGPVTLAERYPAQQEVVLELGPFVGVSDPVLADRTQFSPPFDEGLMGGDEVLGEHRGVPASGVEVEMAQQGCGDVQRQTAVDDVGGEQAAKVVRRKPHRFAGIVQSGHYCQVGEDPRR